MTTSEFFKIKCSKRIAQSNELFGLKESGETSELLDFAGMLHKKCHTITGQGSKVRVLTSRAEYYYTIYTNCILRIAILSDGRQSTREIYTR